MYKLMIVDDEQIVIDAITHIINKSIKDVEVVACAKTVGTQLKRQERLILKSFLWTYVCRG